MTTISEAIKAFKIRNPQATPDEIRIFIAGWTAHEVAVEVAKLLTIKAN